MEPITPGEHPWPTGPPLYDPAPPTPASFAPPSYPPPSFAPPPYPPPPYAPPLAPAPNRSSDAPPYASAYGFGAPTPPPGPRPPVTQVRRGGSGWYLALVLAVVAGLAVGALAVGITSSSLSTLLGPSARSTPTELGQAGGSSGRSGANGGASGPAGSGSNGSGSNGSGSNGSGSNGSGAPAPSTWAEVASVVNPGVVDIETRVPGGIGAGTGMVLSADGEILTNNHVIDGASQIVVTIVTTGDQYRATVVGADPAHDVAVLQLASASGLATIPIGDSDTVQVGDQIAAIGNAGGRGGTPSVATGQVVGLDQQITASDTDGTNAETLTGMIQVDANVVPGDSGGPLADTTGKVVGINTAAGASQGRHQSRSSQGFAIPINQALSIAEQLRSGDGAGASGGSGSGSVAAHGYLGVQVQSGGSDGAVIAGVQAGSPAEQAGLAAGDTITAIDGEGVASAADLTSALSQSSVGQQVLVTWQTAAGRELRATVTLGG